MHHPFQSQYYWSALLSKLAAIPFFVLLLLVITSQLRTLTPDNTGHSPGWRQPDAIQTVQ